MPYTPEKYEGSQSLFNLGCSHKVESPKEYGFTLTDIKKDKLYRDFMEQWHYSHSAEVSAMYSFKLSCPKCYDIIAAAIYSKPAMNSIYKLYAESEEEVLELRRLVAIDNTPKNTESWFIGKTLKWLVKNTDKKTVVTYADPQFGHVGHAYRACNFNYDGLSGNTVVLQLPDGSTVHDRNMRCKDDKGNYTKAAQELRDLHSKGLAKLIPRPPKHRYHYHLFDRRGEKHPCRQCMDNHTEAEITERSNQHKVMEKQHKEIERIKQGRTDVPLFEKIEKAWDKDTSFWPDKFTEDNKSCGQCAVTALTVQDEYGGELVRCDVEGIGSHYYNRLDDGTIIDLTKKQFPPDAKFTEGKIKKRETILKYSSVKKRYDRLKDNMVKINEE
jgi:hypothetical protein